MPLELIAKRTLFEKYYVNEDGTTNLRISPYPIHYNKNGTYAEINNNFYLNTATNPAYYKYQTTNNIFRIGLAEDLSVDKALKFAFRYSGFGQIYSTIKGYALYDSSLDEYTIFETPLNNTVTIEGNKATYTNVLTGVDYEIISNYDGIKEYIYIRDRNNIPDPSIYGYNPETTYVVIVNKLEATLLDINYTNEELELFEAGVKKITSPKEWAKSALDRDIPILNHYNNVTGEYIFGIPYTKMMIVSLPITIDPTWLSTYYSNPDANNYNYDYFHAGQDTFSFSSYLVYTNPTSLSTGYYQWDENHQIDVKNYVIIPHYENHRSAIRLNLPSINGNNLTSAKLYLGKYFNNPITDTAPLKITRINQQLLTTGTQSDSQTSYNTIASSPEILSITTGTLSNSSYSVLDITETVRDWLNNTYPNYGLGLHTPTMENYTYPNLSSQSTYFHPLNSTTWYPYIELTYTQEGSPTNFIGTPKSNGRIEWSWTDNSNTEAFYLLKDKNNNVLYTLPPNTTKYIEPFNYNTPNIERRITAKFADTTETGYERALASSNSFVPVQIKHIGTNYTTHETNSITSKQFVFDTNGNMYYYLQYKTTANFWAMGVRKVDTNGVEYYYTPNIGYSETIVNNETAIYTRGSSSTYFNAQLLIDNANNLHLFYIDLGDYTLKKRVFNGTNWLAETIIKSGLRDFAITIDNSDNFHLLGYENNNLTSKLKYCKSSDNFSSEKFISTVGNFVSYLGYLNILLGNNDNKIYFIYSYFKSTSQQVVGNYLNITNDIMSSEIRLSHLNGNNEMKNPSCVIDSNNIIHLVYFDSVLNNITYKGFSYSGWNNDNVNLTVLGTGTTSSSHAITIDTSDNLYAFWNNVSTIYQRKKLNGSWKNTITMTINTANSKLNAIYNKNQKDNIILTYGYNVSTYDEYYYKFRESEPPDTPPNFRGTTQTLSSITWNWDNVENEKGYKILDSNNMEKQALGIDVTSWTETGLTFATNYTRKIISYNNTGNSLSSTISVATANLNPPSGLLGTALSSSRIEWTFNQYLEAVEYYLYDINDIKFGRIIKEGSTWNVYLDSSPSITIQSHTSPKYIMSGLNANTSYTLKVASRYSSEISTLKSVSSATTNSLPTFNSFDGIKNGLNNLTWHINK